MLRIQITFNSLHTVHHMLFVLGKYNFFALRGALPVKESIKTISYSTCFWFFFSPHFNCHDIKKNFECGISQTVHELLRTALITSPQPPHHASG